MAHDFKVFGIAVDTLANKHVVILKNNDGSLTVPVWISMPESVAMATVLIGREVSVFKGKEDLFSSLLAHLDITVACISLDKDQNGLVTGEVLFLRGSEEICLPVLVSEAISTSVKFRIPLSVSDDVVSMSSLDESGRLQTFMEQDAGRFADFLERLDPVELGKYPM